MQKILGAVRRAIEDYDMIKDGEKVCVGVSGGKDSMILMLALHELSKFYPKKFSVVGLSLDTGIPDMDFTYIKSFCSDHNIEYHIKKCNIYNIIFNERHEKNPCSLCARLRRGALHNASLELGCSKIALGHHYDDVIETMMLNLFYEGRIGCFSPVTFLDRKKITVIRPLIYAHENDIIRSVNKNNIPIVISNCPANGNTERQAMKEKLRITQKEYPKIKKQIFGALQRSNIDGWKYI